MSRTYCTLQFELLCGSVFPPVVASLFILSPMSEDNGKLPFMAMLRNLCNMLRTGISARHHELVLQRLQHEVSVGRGCCVSARLTAVMAAGCFLCGV